MIQDFFMLVAGSPLWVQLFFWCSWISALVWLSLSFWKSMNEWPVYLACYALALVLLLPYLLVV
jgi:hypothetical protein